MKSKPDENLLKFKKAHETLINTVGQLVCSDKYLAGDLGTLSDGSAVSNTELCESIANLISTKSVNCVDVATDSDFIDARKLEGGVYKYDESILGVAGNYDNAPDGQCGGNTQGTGTNSNAQTLVGDEIVASDGTVFYDPAPKYPFSLKTNDCGHLCRLYGEPETTEHTFENSFNGIYKAFCIDIDGKDGALPPFGYAIRVDGKIIPGGRAKEWLERSAKEE